MGSTPFISHSINGYSRYDIPENVAFSASAGVLYPVRVDFLNARDVRYIQAGATIRTTPALLPTFTPFRVSLHRFFAPMQLYHPEMRVNSSKFDFQTLSTNCLVAGIFGYNPSTTESVGQIPDDSLHFYGRSLMSFLGLWSGRRLYETDGDPLHDTGYASALGTEPFGSSYVNADPVLAYYDIIRSYYSFSQTGALSLAFPCPIGNLTSELNVPIPTREGAPTTPTQWSSVVQLGKPGTYWRQTISNLEPFDTLFETSFYPRRGEARGLYYDRSVDICETVYRSVERELNYFRTEDMIQKSWNNYTYRYFVPGLGSGVSVAIPLKCIWSTLLPYGVAPAIADRFSRLLPVGSTDDVSLTSISTVRGLAFAAKLQAYKDLLSSGGNRFTDWLMTFFAAKVSHVDRPVLLYSSSFYLNSAPIFSQQGGETLGSYAGVIDGNSTFGKKVQRYCFDEPGYLIDLFCIRPVYYWAGIQKDFARYDKMDYFNPIFNEVGYETLPPWVFGGAHADIGLRAIAKQPCYNEFRASYDRVLGDLALVPGLAYSGNPWMITSWVQQRSNISAADTSNLKYLSGVYFTDVDQANSVFTSHVEDNFYVNLYYNVTSKSLVSKNFATNLATR